MEVHAANTGALTRGISQRSALGLPHIDEETSYVDQISMLWQAPDDPGCSQLGDDEAREVRNNRRAMKIAVLVMMVCGALYDFLAKSIYMLMPGVDSGLTGLKNNKWLTLLLTLGSFIACAVPPTLKKTNRDALVANSNLSFLTKLAAPSLLDLVITGFRFAALVFLPPAVVSILKNSVQLLSISLINRMRGKKLTRQQWSALGGALAGDIIITVANSIKWGNENDDPDTPTNSSHEIIGIVIICFSAVLGAIRNVIEEMILQENDFPDGALLMVESWVSAIFVFLISLVMGLTFKFEGLGEQMKHLFSSEVVVFFLVFLVTAYGKDAGKLKVVKYASAIVGKVLALLFPFGTWALSVSAWYITTGAKTTTIGEPLLWPQSFIRLVGFLLITVSTTIFVKLKKK